MSSKTVPRCPRGAFRATGQGDPATTVTQCLTSRSRSVRAHTTGRQASRYAYVCGCKTARGGPALRRCAGGPRHRPRPAPRARAGSLRPGARPPRPRGCFKRALAPTTLPALGRVAVNPARGGETRARVTRVPTTPPTPIRYRINYGLTCVSTFETSAPLYFIFGTLSRRNRSKIQRSN